MDWSTWRKFIERGVKESEMKLCENCHIYEAMPVALKDKRPEGVIMPLSPSDTKTFFFPTEAGKLCYYCQKVEDGRINPSERIALYDERIYHGNPLR